MIPKNLADFVANEGAEHELLESWLVQEVEKGTKLPGLYPPNEDNKKRYEDGQIPMQDYEQSLHHLADAKLRLLKEQKTALEPAK